MMRSASLEAKERGTLVSLNAEDVLRALDSNTELLEALLALEEVDGFKGWHHTYDEACAKARAAIAKATGNA